MLQISLGAHQCLGAQLKNKNLAFFFLFAMASLFLDF